MSNSMILESQRTQESVREYCGRVLGTSADAPSGLEAPAGGGCC
jgi:hypothetical protein